MRRKVSLSIVIPTLNRPDYVKMCLESIREQTVDALECIVVDQSDNDKTRNLFNSFDLGGTEKKYVYQKTKSLIRARNNGLDHAAATEYLCFLDDDLKLLPDFFERLIARFELDTEKRFAGGMGTFNGRELNRARFNELFLMPHDGDGKFLPNGMPTFPHWRKEFCEVEFLSGGITMYRTDIIKKFRFDERMIGYGQGDDVDTSFRISRHYKMFFDPQARCYHDDHSPGRDPGLVHRKNQMQNAYYLLRKNIGINAKSVSALALFALGQSLDDLRNMRKGAFIGNFIALKNIAMGKLDSIEGYTRKNK